MDTITKPKEKLRNKVRSYSKDIFIILLILIILLLFSCTRQEVAFSNIQGNQKTIAEGIAWDGDFGGAIKEYANETITFSVSPSFYVNSDNKSINLGNPKENTVYFEYILIKEKQELYRTDLISPGEAVKADLHRLLGEGEHHLIFQINTYDIESQIACNGTRQEVVIIVED